MTSMARAAAVPAFNARTADREAEIAPSFSREVYRLADALAPVYKAGAHCILLLNLGGEGAPSLWLANEVGCALATTLEIPLNVLTTGRSQHEQTAMEPRRGRGCVVESLESTVEGNDRISPAERLAELRTADRSVLLHASHEESLPAGLLHSGAIDKVVLLARAGHTRRAVVQAVVHRMSLAGVPLLGCVLLDRTHPVPEGLYRRL